MACAARVGAAGVAGAAPPARLRTQQAARRRAALQAAPRRAAAALPSARRARARCYEPSPVDPSIVRGQLAVLGSVGAATAYWWFVLVPGARVRLAVNKRSGALGKYLRDLKADDSGGREAEKWFYSSWLSRVDPETRYLLRDENVDGVGLLDGEGEAEGSAPTKLGESGGVSGAPAGETLRDVARKARNTPDFWSLDNPVLTATALILGTGLLFGSH